MKRVGIILIQLVVTGTGLWYVFHDQQKRAQIADALRHAQISWVLAGWLCYSVVEMLATVRWQILLRVQGIRLSWLRAGAIVMIGLFFNQFLPGAVGGDVMRLYYGFKQAPRKKVGVALSIAMDRLFGLLTIVFLAAVSVSLRFSWLSRSRASLHITYLALTLLGAALVFIVLVFWFAKSGFLRRLPKAAPFRKQVMEFGDALLCYRTHFLAMLGAFLITIASHLAYYVSFYCAGQSLRASTGHAANLKDIVSIMPLVNTITSVPISLGGTGVRETLFQQLLGNLANVPPALAAFTASLGYANQVFWALIGAAVFLSSRKIISQEK